MRLRALSGILIVWGTALLVGHLANAAATAHALHRPLAGDGVLIAAIAALLAGILMAAVAFAQPAGPPARLGSAHRLTATSGASVSASRIPAWRPPRRASVIAVALAALVITAIYTLYVLVYTGLATCGGDGGTPYADAGSVAAWYCNNTAAHALEAALAVRNAGGAHHRRDPCNPTQDMVAAGDRVDDCPGIAPDLRHSNAAVLISEPRPATTIGAVKVLSPVGSLVRRRGPSRAYDRSGRTERPVVVGQWTCLNGA